ncbi:MAG: glycosyltransferase family 9 protein [Candidatus Binatia bacterium]
MRVLIVLPGALGDVVRGLPLLGRLRRAHPTAMLAWVVEPLSFPLLDGHPWIDRVHRLDRRPRVRGILRAAREARATGYDVTLDLGRGIKSALVARGSGARRRIGFARGDAREASWLFATEHVPRQGVTRSKLEQFLRFGDPFGASEGPIEFGLAPTPAERAEAVALVGEGVGLVAACVGSSCPSRRWWPGRTAAVLDALHDRHGTRAVVLGAGTDVTFGERVVAAARSPVTNLAGRTSLRQLLAVLARVQLAFGPDSGALHLAAALGVRVVSLWGATSALRSAPFGSERWTVAGAAPCSPCFLTRCPIGRPCMAAIDVGTVVASASEAAWA